MSPTSGTPRRIPALSVLAMTFAGGIARTSTLASQIIVGNFLTDREFGTYAVAVGITGFTVMLRGGGISHYLPTLRPEDYDRNVGRIFWWGFWFRLLAAVATLAVGLLLPALDLKDPPPRLAETLYVFSASQLFLAFSVIGRVRMAVAQRFPELARLDIANAIFRVVATAILAWLGAGPLALVIPITLAPAIELAYFAINGTMGSINYRWSGGTVRQTAGILLWPLIVSILLSLNSQLNFLVVKPLLALASMGIYYFAYQLASQPMMMLTGPLTNVLATHFANERGDETRESRAVIQTTSGAVLFSALLCCMLIALFPSAERMLWGGKWADATIAISALAFAGCWATAAGLLSSALAGLRRFKAMASFEALKGVGIFAGAALGAVLVEFARRGGFAAASKRLEGVEDTIGDFTSDSSLVSIATASMVALMSIGQLLWLLRTNGARPTAMFLAVTQGPILGALAAAGAIAGGSIVSNILVGAEIGLSPRPLAALECVATCAIYVGLAVLVVRFTAPAALRDAVSLLPSRLRTTVARVLRLS